MADVLVKHNAQVRIIEAVIAAILILVVFTAAFSMIMSSQNVSRQEAVDLNKLAYNTLHRLAESNAIEESIESNAPNNLQRTLQELLPQGVYYYLSVNRTYPSTGSWTFSNADAQTFEAANEVASSSLTYTSKYGNIYLLVLKLMRITA